MQKPTNGIPALVDVLLFMKSASKCRLHPARKRSLKNSVVTIRKSSLLVRRKTASRSNNVQAELHIPTNLVIFPTVRRCGLGSKCCIHKYLWIDHFVLFFSLRSRIKAGVLWRKLIGCWRLLMTASGSRCVRLCHHFASYILRSRGHHAL